MTMEPRTGALTWREGDMSEDRHVSLRRDGVEILFRFPATGGLPDVVHWGAALSDADSPAEVARATRRGVGPSALDAHWFTTIVPGEPDGWEGRATIAGHHSGVALLPRWHVTSVRHSAGSLVIEAEATGIEITTSFELDEAGVLRTWNSVTNRGERALELTGLESVLPVGDVVAEFQDLSGRWIRERSPQRGPLLEGSRTRISQRGRTGHDSPFLSIVGSPGFDSDSGEVWGVHLAWSGDAVYRTDALPEAGAHIGAGPLLRAGEISLQSGESFQTPIAAFVYSDHGLDGLSSRMHRSLRARATHPRTPRPVTLNTWEAVYFAHDLTTLIDLASRGAEIGVERFVLDDGWFLGRRNDLSGLGDWTVDPQAWPRGLHPLADHVRGLGMEFGLWVEPEMVNLDSELAREHPDWLLQDAADGALSWRNQFVLDLGRSEVRAYLLASLSALVTEYDLSYLKWDQNRDVLEATSSGRASLHHHTLGVYRLMAELKNRHPALEIESCASGGARVDLGVLEHTDRVWASDTNDPLERLAIQRWTQLLLPPELIGAHVGPARAHTTGRTTDLSFRIAVSLFDSFGIEWDITRCSSEELAELADGVRAYRRLRGLVHRAMLHHPDSGDAGLDVVAAVASEADHAVVRVARIRSDGRSLPIRLRVPGLRDDQLYRVAPMPELRLPRTNDHVLPQWLAEGGVVASGRALARAGLRLPMLHPEQALVIEITSV